MSKFYEVAIIGGGSAGLMCAVELLRGDDALSGQDVLILERNDRVGKKLISTGNGQGNLCNANFGIQFYYGDKAFVKAFVDQANEIDIQKYLLDLGIPLVTTAGGKMYPISKQASAVLDILRAFLSSRDCQIETGVLVEQIKRTSGGFMVMTNGDTYFAKNVIFATGGKSQKQMGTDGTSYAIAEKLGHKVTKLYPSLVQLKTELTDIKGLRGLKETAKVTAYDGNKELKSATGEILFTEYGVSGNAVFMISSALADVKDPIIKVEFLPDYTATQIEQMLSSRQKEGYFNGELYLCGLVNKKIGQAVQKRAKSNSASDVTYALKNFTIKVTGNLGFNYSQVTRGGLFTDQVDPYTMQSKIQKSFYLIGEVLDIDGDCGGYNLTFAFISAIVSARAIKHNKSK